MQGLQVKEPRGRAAKNVRWEDPMLEQAGRSLRQCRKAVKKPVSYVLCGWAFVAQMRDKVQSCVTERTAGVRCETFSQVFAAFEKRLTVPNAGAF